MQAFEAQKITQTELAHQDQVFWNPAENLDV